MNAPQEILPFDINDLKHIIIISGHYGVGKTNVALQLARSIASCGRRVGIVDLDIINPYFRISEYEAFLSKEHIALASPHYAYQSTSLDVPSLPASTYYFLSSSNEFDHVIVDVGGDDEGALTLGRYVSQLIPDHCMTLYIINAFRYMTPTIEKLRENMEEIASVLPFQIDYIINNSHLMNDTSLHDLQHGIDIAHRLSQDTKTPLLFTTYNPQCVVPTEDMKATDTFFALTPVVTTPW